MCSQRKTKNERIFDVTLQRSIFPDLCPDDVRGKCKGQGQSWSLGSGMHGRAGIDRPMGTPAAGAAATLA